jgi:hypothetical protein
VRELACVIVGFDENKRGHGTLGLTTLMPSGEQHALPLLPS